MPIYSYVCQRCSHTEHRLTAVDDHQVECTLCGQPMRRPNGMSMILAQYRRGCGVK